ncbi:MAG: zinc ribbon domain-containing protein [Chloroflexota bacterium]
MTRKSVGYVQLEWTCPNCQTRNPGPQKTCSSCGLPQPENVKFEQPAQEKLIKDQAAIAQAQAGPDIHCHYCGARNPVTAKTCSQCGAALSEGAARASGQVLGAFRDQPAQPITCPNCGAANPADAPRCGQCGASLVKPAPLQARATAAAPRRFPLIGAVAVIILLLICGACATYFVLFNRTEDTTGQVQAVAWTRTVVIEALTPVTHEGWRDQIPAGAVIGTCTRKVHHTEDRPTGQTREICGTPYTVDKGTGYGEVVQDCTTEEVTEPVEVYADSCQYKVQVWQAVDKLTLQGNDLNARWPDPALRAGQRAGERQESYSITFQTEQDTYTYETGNADLFTQAQIGSRWILEVNTFNTVTGIKPVQ